MKEIEKYWKDSFDNSASNNKNDFEIAQWSEHGLKKRIKYFFQVFNKFKVENEFTVLDIGCGAGTYSNLILEKEKKSFVFASDYSINMLNVTKENLKLKNQNNFSLIQNKIDSLPYKNNSFNLVVCFGVLQHVSDAKKSINEIFRVSKKNTECYINVPNNSFFYKKSELTSNKLFKWYNYKDLFEIAKEAGFSKWEMIPVYLFPKPIRFLEKFFDESKILNKHFLFLAHDLLIVLTK